MLTGVTPPDGPFSLVKVTPEGLGQAARGVWKSTDGQGREVFQVVDFRVNFWAWGDAMMIYRIMLTDAEHVPGLPDTACNLSHDAPALW